MMQQKTISAPMTAKQLEARLKRQLLADIENDYVLRAEDIASYPRCFLGHLFGTLVKIGRFTHRSAYPSSARRSPNTGVHHEQNE